MDVIHDGHKFTILRTQDQGNTIMPEFARTSRKCPPFCVQPGELAPGVKTIAELEVLDLLERMASGDASVLVIDSRTPASAQGAIPGTVNIPWDTLDVGKSDPAAVDAILKTPPNKLLWYRGGMQEWEGLGLTTL